MRLALRQPPQQKGVDGAKGQLARLRRRPRAVDMIEQPGDLGGGKISSVAHTSAVRRSCQTMAL
jgi:hypothetical protein